MIFAEDDPKLTKLLQTMLLKVIKDGFILPIYVLAITVDGSFILLKFYGTTPDLDVMVLADNLEEEGVMPFPINFAFFDSTGKAQRCQVKSPNLQPTEFN